MPMADRKRASAVLSPWPRIRACGRVSDMKVYRPFMGGEIFLVQATVRRTLLNHLFPSCKP